MKIIGLMSGTSLDGISAAVVRFTAREGGLIDQQLLAFIGSTYTSEQRSRLHAALTKGGRPLILSGSTVTQLSIGISPVFNQSCSSLLRGIPHVLVAVR